MLQQDFYPVAARDLVLSNQVVGVPLMYEGLALLYNQNMLQAANALPPSDWQQVRELAVNLTIKNGQRIERGGIALGTAENVDHFSDILALMMLQNSADLANPASVNAQSALEFFTIFSRVDQVWDATLPPSTQAFASEQVAMIFAPSWRIHEIQSLNPNLSIGVARLPQIDGTQVSWATYWAEGVSSTSRNKEESWKFLNYLSQPEQLRAMHSDAGSVRAYGELYPRVSMASELKSNPMLSPYLDDALYSQSWYLASDTLDEGLNAGLIQYYTDAVNAMNQSGNAERALQAILPGLQQVLSRYGLGGPVVAQ
jgi:multiple sugar transport system substrate-binding protein